MRLSLLLACALWPAAAIAQQAPVDAAPETDEPAEDSWHDDEARSLFDAATLAFADERFSEARSHFIRAYELSGRSELLYNVALSEERLDDFAAAVEAFEAFLEAVPDTPHRAAVESRLRILRRAAAVDDGDEPPEETPAPAPTAPSSSTPTWWLLPVSLAAVGVGLAIGFGLHAAAIHDGFANEPCVGLGNCTREDLDASDGPLFVTLTNVSWAVAGGLAIVAGVVLAVELSSGGETTVAVGLDRISLRQRF